jgi:transcriptional regulator with XRE-family HTH domain
MNENLGDRIRLCRKNRDLTQSQLAKQLGVSTSSLGQYETGSARPNIETLTLISEICNVTTDWLLKGIPNNELTSFIRNNHSFDPEKNWLKEQIADLKKDKENLLMLLHQKLEKHEVIDQQAGAYQDRPPVRSKPDAMTEQLDEAA